MPLAPIRPTTWTASDPNATTYTTPRMRRKIQFARAAESATLLYSCEPERTAGRNRTHEPPSGSAVRRSPAGEGSLVHGGSRPPSRARPPPAPARLHRRSLRPLPPPSPRPPPPHHVRLGGQPYASHRPSAV